MARFSQSGGGNPDLNLIKTKRWGYPTPDSVAIIPANTGETIALKSSGGAQLRWHIRDTGRSVVDYQVNILSFATMNYAEYNGMTYVTFNIEIQDIPLPTGVYYGVNINSGNTDFNAYVQASDATLNTLTLVYDGDITSWDTTDIAGYLQLPSIYSQVQADSDGVWIKNDNWSQEPYENVWWQFQRDGGFKFPDGSVQYSAVDVTGTPVFNDLEIDGNLFFKAFGDNTDTVYATKQNITGNTSVLKLTVGDDGGANVNASYPVDGSNIHSDGFAIATTGGDIHHYMNVAGDYHLAGKVIPSSGVQFPDGNTQTVAFLPGTGQLKFRDTVPLHDHGAAGDKKYDACLDGSYLYICNQDYVNDSTVIWKRLAYSSGNW